MIEMTEDPRDQKLYMSESGNWKNTDHGADFKGM